MNIVVYDCEIKKAIARSSEPRLADIEYCDGWRDFKGMGISMISVFEFETRMPRLFMAENMVEFFLIAERADMLVSFNGWNFDNPLLETIGVKITHERSYDLLRGIWAAAGLDPNSFGHHHLGFGLNDMCMANLGIGKLSDGANAAIMYQRGEFGRLADYALRDIMLTARLLELAKRQPLINPKLPDLFSSRLHVHVPFDVPPISPSV